jgi:outer membrane protein assembly factor BamB
VATLAGVRQVVHFTADALMGVEEQSGKILWRIPLKTGAKRHACTPVIGPDSVIVASTSIGTRKFNIVKHGSEVAAEEGWVNSSCKTILGTPTLLGKYLFTLGPNDHTELECLDFGTGAQIWTQPGFGDYASLTTVNDKILVLNSSGELVLIKADPTKYVELGRVQLCAKTWASPAYSDGKIYVKDEASVTAIALAQ